MPPKKAELVVKRGRGRPPKNASATPTEKTTAPARSNERPPIGVSNNSASAAVTPLKRGPGRPPKDSTTPKAASARPKSITIPTLPARKPGRPPKSQVLSESKKPNHLSSQQAPAKTPSAGIKKRGRPPKSQALSTSKKPSHPPYQKGPAKIPSAGIRKRGRPPGSTNAKKAHATSKSKAAETVSKAGRPQGKHVSNLSSNLKSLISSASKGRLVELLSVLCDRNAVVAKATSNALREESLRREANDDDDDNNEEDVLEKAEHALEAEGYEQHGDSDVLVFSKPHGHGGKTNGTAKGRGRAKVKKDVNITVEKNIHVTVDDDQQVHTEQGAEPKSGYDADVEPEIPATATEADDAQGISPEHSVAGTETIVDAVSSVRDSAFRL